MRLAILKDIAGNTYAVPPDKVMIASAHDNRLCEMQGISKDSVVAFVFDTRETPLDLAMTFEEAVKEVEAALIDLPMVTVNRFHDLKKDER